MRQRARRAPWRPALSPSSIDTTYWKLQLRPSSAAGGVLAAAVAPRRRGGSRRTLCLRVPGSRSEATKAKASLRSVGVRGGSEQQAQRVALGALAVVRKASTSTHLPVDHRLVRVDREACLAEEVVRVEPAQQRVEVLPLLERRRAPPAGPLESRPRGCFYIEVFWSKLARARRLARHDELGFRSEPTRARRLARHDELAHARTA
jgi:hypothetical protein